MAVRNVVLKALLERQHLRHQLPCVHIGHQRQHDHAERALHRRMLVQLVQHDPRNRIAFQLDHDANTIAVGFVAQRADAGEPLLLHQFGNIQHQLARIRLIGHLGHDNLRFPARLLFFNHGACPHDNASATGILIVGNAGATVDVAAGRKVRPLHQLAQSGPVEFRVVDKRHHRRNHFAQVVRWNIRGHTHRDTRRSVRQQIRKTGRHHTRFFKPVVEVGGKVNRILVNVGQHFHGDAHQP